MTTIIFILLLVLTCAARACPIDPTATCCLMVGPSKLKMTNIQTLRSRGVDILEDGVLGLSHNETGNDLLRFYFDQCNVSSRGYSSGATRNSGGSMGAPLEYFGRVRLGDSACLTVVYGLSDDDESAVVKILPCACVNGTILDTQLFVLAVGATETLSISFIGNDKNTSLNIYQGPRKYWQPSAHRQRHRPRPILISDTPSSYVMLLDEA